GVARKIHDLHTVEERSGNVLDEIRGGNKQHFAQIERNAEVVIGEGVVLSRIEHLEQRARWIALERRSELIDLVEQEDWILRSRLLESLHDSARHRSDVSAAVSSDVRFVARATQSYAHVLAAQ